MRRGPHAPGDDRRRAVPAGHHQRRESDQRDVLPGRSARPGGVRARRRRPGVSLPHDQKMRKIHMDSIRTLADGTDGIAVVDSNDLDKGLKKISDDLTSYYLLGYYSTNTKLDGGYRALKVQGDTPRGQRPRAARLSRGERGGSGAGRGPAAAAPAVDVGTPVQAALGMLGSIRPESRIRLRATTVTRDEHAVGTGEVSPKPAGRRVGPGRNSGSAGDRRRRDGRRAGHAQAGRPDVPHVGHARGRGRPRPSTSRRGSRRPAAARPRPRRSTSQPRRSRCSIGAARPPPTGRCRPPTCASPAPTACIWSCPVGPRT